MYCAFVDFEKAFDNIWRVALWYKLLLNKINGKMYNFIVNMYNSIKSCIVYNANKSDFFSSEVGVRQGENLSLSYLKTIIFVLSMFTLSFHNLLYS
jgi:hypothetical protein